MTLPLVEQIEFKVESKQVSLYLHLGEYNQNGDGTVGYSKEPEG